MNLLLENKANVDLQDQEVGILFLLAKCSLRNLCMLYFYSNISFRQNCTFLAKPKNLKKTFKIVQGMSALHWTAQAGHLDATKLLYQCSAFLNPMEFTEERLTPLDHALLNESEDVAQYLMEQGRLFYLTRV